MFGVISNLMGWDYLFKDHAPPRAQQAASRATLAAFQTYPANEIQGRGTMVTQNGVTAGKYWNIVQPPQVYAAHRGVTENLLGGGTQAGSLVSTPLIPNNSNTSGLS